MSVPSEDSVQYNILIQAADAMKNLDAMNASATSLDEVINNTTQTVLSFANQTNLSTSSVIAMFDKLETKAVEVRAAIAELGTGITNPLSQSISEIQGPSGGVLDNTVWTNVRTNVSELNSEMKTFDTTTKEALDPAKPQGFSAGIDIISVAIGTLTSRLVYGLFNAIRDTFNQAIQAANDYTKALYQIQTAQDILAQRGITTTQKELLDIVQQVNKEFGVFSKTQLTEAVAQAALLTQNFGFTKDQITQVVQIASALAIQKGDLSQIGTNIEQITRGLTTGTAPAALAKLGVDVKASSEEIKNMETALYGATKGLTDQQVATATLDVLMQHLNPEIKDFATYQDTLAGKEAAVAKARADTLLSLGQSFNILKDYILGLAGPILDFFDKSIKGWMIFYSQFEAGLLTINYAIKNHITDINDLNAQYANFQKQIMDTFNGLATSADTATQSTDTLKTSLIDTSKIDLSSLVDQITSMSNQMDKTTRNFVESQANSEADYNTKAVRAYQDYQLKREQTIADSNAKVADINAKARAKEVDEEAKFQEKMRELRERYLFDLEDALRARDAKQVIRLMEKYQMDKTDAENNFALQQKTEAEQATQERAAAVKATNEKLAQDDAAYKLKAARELEDYNTSRNRAVAKYQQDLADQKAAWDLKLQQEAQKLADQYGLNKDQTDKLYQLLKDYYGPQGKIDGLYDYSYQSLVTRATNLRDAIVTLVNQANQALASVGAGLSGSQVHSEASRPSSTQGNGDRGQIHHGPYASGGMDIATSPTTATYGEAGPEAHIFLPLTNVPSSPSLSLGGGNAGGGRLALDITLSPDLISRVTENTLNKTADIITRVRRGK